MNQQHKENIIELEKGVSIVSLGYFIKVFDESSQPQKTDL